MASSEALKVISFVQRERALLPQLPIERKRAPQRPRHARLTPSNLRPMLSPPPTLQRPQWPSLRAGSLSGLRTRPASA